MTEIERIIEQGILPATFFKEEERCGYLVTEKRKKVWAIQVDLLLELDRVCRKYGLHFFMSDGSLLGVVRHHGFIPWDDDIDVNMLRDDYEKLMKLGPSVFKYPYFLQTPYTDKDAFFSYANLRNSNTTGLIYPFRYQNYNHGINIDIFPLDNCKLDDVEQRFNRIRNLVMDNSAYMRKSNPNPDPADVERILNHSGRDPLDVYDEMVSICIQYKEEKLEFVNSSTEVSYAWNKLMFKREWFDDIIYRNFEGISVPIISKYDDYLKIHYGDYMKLPPIDEREQWHSKMVYEPDIPYDKFVPIIRKEGIQSFFL